MESMTTLEAAEKWHISKRRVERLCSEKRIDGAERVGKTWRIPKDAPKPEDGRATPFNRSADMPVRPFVKWAGGKSQILEEIRRKYPAGLGQTVSKYAEPFVGGGAVLFDVLGRYDLKEVYVSDVNRELVATYCAIRDHAAELIETLQTFEGEYVPAVDERRKELYYANRDRFNFLKASGSADVELAALFIFLNRTCFNGLYRVNSQGAYNVPQGRYKKPSIFDGPNVMAVSEKLQVAEIVCADFRDSRDFIDEKTFAYFDPPYRPLTSTASFTSYAEGRFGDEEQAALAGFIDEMSQRGAHIVASNSDPKNADEQDDFFDKLYSRHNITRISASRAINSVGGSRGKISELLICND
ncbi:MAG: Dam family site-specific DNA-(adenine-N6)-methyltransferase [Deltaproteobacteria bacterium]|jgi:DNA adenine methylase|nr:Dam family site-specific DNA-(adenine-N6)-methyltransferase [Deltaproteobacteria bacterium]